MKQRPQPLGLRRIDAQRPLRRLQLGGLVAGATQHDHLGPLGGLAQRRLGGRRVIQIELHRGGQTRLGGFTTYQIGAGADDHDRGPGARRAALAGWRRGQNGGPRRGARLKQDAMGQPLFQIAHYRYAGAPGHCAMQRRIPAGQRQPGRFQHHHRFFPQHPLQGLGPDAAPQRQQDAGGRRIDGQKAHHLGGIGVADRDQPAYAQVVTAQKRHHLGEGVAAGDDQGDPTAPRMLGQRHRERCDAVEHCSESQSCTGPGFRRARQGRWPGRRAAGPLARSTPRHRSAAPRVRLADWRGRVAPPAPHRPRQRRGRGEAATNR